MDIDKIRELLKVVSDSGVAEVEIEEDDFKVIVRRNAPNVTVQSPPPQSYGYPPYGMPMAAPYPPQGGMPQAGGVPQEGVQPPGGMPSPGGGGAGAPQAGSQPPQPTQAPASSTQARDTPDTEAEEEGPQGEVVHAPIVGTFYRAPAPEEDAFVAIGDTVQKGETLCIIEAMKLMNEIEAEFSGTVMDILVENEEPVEYDQPLFVVDPT